MWTQLKEYKLSRRQPQFQEKFLKLFYLQLFREVWEGISKWIFVNMRGDIMLFTAV
jgi:hypothetical protein